MAKYICKYCNKEFKAKPSQHRQFCCKECADKYFLEKLLNNDDYFEMILHYKNNKFEGCENL